MAKRRYVRLGDSLDDDDDIVVVRGGELDVETLRSDAARYRDVYGVFGCRFSPHAASPSTSWRNSRRSFASRC